VNRAKPLPSLRLLLVVMGRLKHLRFCRVVNLPTNGVAHFFFESAISARIAAR
jgi:hypothetical protein